MNPRNRALPIDDRTIVTQEEDGAEVREPIPGMEVCDTCLRTDPAWEYPAPGVTLEVEGQVIMWTNDPWTLCDACASYVMVGDTEGLVDRTYQAVLEQREVSGERASLARRSVELMIGDFMATCGEGRKR